MIAIDACMPVTLLKINATMRMVGTIFAKGSFCVVCLFNIIIMDGLKHK